MRSAVMNFQVLRCGVSWLVLHRRRARDRSDRLHRIHSRVVRDLTIIAIRIRMRNVTSAWASASLSGRRP